MDKIEQSIEKAVKSLEVDLGYITSNKVTDHQSRHERLICLSSRVLQVRAIISSWPGFDSYYKRLEDITEVYHTEWSKLH